MDGPIQILRPAQKAQGFTSALHRWHPTMISPTFHSLVCLLVVLSSGFSASADSIGPRAVLPIVNRKIAPDGFLRQ